MPSNDPFPDAQPEENWFESPGDASPTSPEEAPASDDQPETQFSVPKCRDCQLPMQDGYIVDFGHKSQSHLQQWVDGQPKRRPFWNTLILWNRVRFLVATFRCPGCGRLEQYALQPATKSPHAY